MIRRPRTSASPKKASCAARHGPMEDSPTKSFLGCSRPSGTRRPTTEGRSPAEDAAELHESGSSWPVQGRLSPAQNARAPERDRRLPGVGVKLPTVLLRAPTGARISTARRPRRQPRAHRPRAPRWAASTSGSANDRPGVLKLGDNPGRARPVPPVPVRSVGSLAWGLVASMRAIPFDVSVSPETPPPGPGRSAGPGTHSRRTCRRSGWHSGSGRRAA